jgi:hypothetical protein
MRFSANAIARALPFLPALLLVACSAAPEGAGDTASVGSEAASQTATSASAQTTYTFATNVSISPDKGLFFAPGGSSNSGIPQGSMQIQFTDNSGTITVASGHSATFAGFGASCGSSNAGSGCVPWYLDATQTNTISGSISAGWSVSIYLTQGTYSYHLIGSLLPAFWLGTGGFSLAAQFWGTTSQWVGASGKTCTGSTCS